MPINYQELQPQIHTLGEHAVQREHSLRERREQALRLLQQAAAQPQRLRERIELAALQDPRLRCAAPAAEGLTLHRPPPHSDQPRTLLAADGSQIPPDRHAAVEFALLNVGLIEMHPQEAAAPQEHITTLLLADDEDHPSGAPLTEEAVENRRDILERQVLARRAAQLPGPVVALTDGPLELFRETGQPELRQYLDELRSLARLSVITAGYVEILKAQLMVRALELLILAEDELGRASQLRPLFGVDDGDLFRGLLDVGERSAVFALQSNRAQSYSQELALHFFYLNVGRPHQPYLARVEIPAWVAQEPASVDLLHAALLAQCAMLGSRPYPYILQRAHEVAVVRFEEAEQVLLMLQRELLSRGLDPGSLSNKLYHKQMSHQRTRYGR